MMKIGVLADTHGDAASIMRVMGKAGEVDAWIHLGDFARDCAYLVGANAYAVRGNCDFSSEYDTEQVVHFEHARILLTHGHRFQPKISRSALFDRAEALHCGLVLYGHTHVSMVESRGTLLAVCPGSPSRPRMGRAPSFAVLDIENGQIRPHIVTI